MDIILISTTLNQGQVQQHASMLVMKMTMVMPNSKERLFGS
ncbi:hypothetical protein [Bacillus sp. NPDC094106]